MYPNAYPGQPQYGVQQGMPQPGLSQPQFGSGYPPMNQPGFSAMHQQGIPQPMNQPGFSAMHQPGMHQQGMSGAYSQQSGYPQMPIGQQLSYPSMQATGFAMPSAPNVQMVQQHQYSQQNSAKMPTQGIQSPTHQSYGKLEQQHHVYGQPSQQAVVTQGRPTLIPAQSFDASNDCAKLRKAMKGFGTDNDGLIEVICRRTNAQRIDINRTFKTCYGKDLMDEIRSETSGNFETLLVSCMTPRYEYYCNELNQAMNGVGTDEDVLIEIFCALSNHEIRSIKDQYGKSFGKNLEREMMSDTSGCFKRLLVSLSNGSRDESMRTDINSAKVDAQALKNAGVGKWGTDESAFNRILCLRNYQQLKLVCKEYENLTGHSLERDIKKEFSGDIEDGLLGIVRCANNRAEFFAQRLYKSMVGLGTNDRSLIRLVVTRCELDMMDIKDAFQRLYGKSLKSFIKGDTSGDYKHALYALIGENRS